MGGGRIQIFEKIRLFTVPSENHHKCFWENWTNGTTHVFWKNKNLKKNEFFAKSSKTCSFLKGTVDVSDWTIPPPLLNQTMRYHFNHVRSKWKLVDATTPSTRHFCYYIDPKEPCLWYRKYLCRCMKTKKCHPCSKLKFLECKTQNAGPWKPYCINLK